MQDPAPMNLTSVFEPDGPIPPRYTCEGRDESPALRWSEVPDNVRTFVLIVDDPDAPGGRFVHWVVYDLPAETCALAEGIPPVACAARGTLPATRGGGARGCA
jgi:Raf kinase inhibitor-like YbhB/YbcL family protein